MQSTEGERAIPLSAVRVQIDDGAVSAARSRGTVKHNGIDRYYYSMPDGTAIVVRFGESLEQLRGKIVDCLIGWSVARDTDGDRNTKITMFRTLAGDEYDVCLSALHNQGGPNNRRS